MMLPIKWTVIYGVLFTVACSLIIAAIVTVQSLDRQHLARLNDVLEAKAKLAEYGLLPLFQSPGERTSASQLQAIVQELAARASVHISLIAIDGTVIADSTVRDADLHAIDNQRARPEIQQAISKGQGQDLRASHITGERTMYHARVIASSHGRPPIIIRLGLPMGIEDQEAAQMKHRILISLGIALLTAVSASILLVRSVTRPLSDIAAATRRLVSETQPIPLTASFQDQTTPLAATLNRLADQLQAKISELAEDRAQLLAVLTSMVEGVLVLDRRGSVLQINPALERIFGISRTEARGRPFAELVRHRQLNELIETLLRTRTNREAEIILPLTGRCLQIEASIAGGGERDNEACVVLVFHDLTQLRHLEKIRKDFVANVSHELRTPLTSIKGYVEALLDGAKDDPGMASSFLDIILKQTDRLNLIIEDLLELSRIESGRIAFREEPIDFQAVVERALSTIKPLAEKKKHRLVTALDKDLPPTTGDEDRLVQVLTNLLDNAVKYTPAGGTIAVEVRDTSRQGTIDHPHGSIELRVSDTGIGIPDSDRPRVFERFYRVDKARSRELGGTGLGLSIVKHIVEGHGGQVWVEANEPKGSRFVVSLPIAVPSRLSTQVSDVSHS